MGVCPDVSLVGQSLKPMAEFGAAQPGSRSGETCVCVCVCVEKKQIYIVLDDILFWSDRADVIMYMVGTILAGFQFFF